MLSTVSVNGTELEYELRGTDAGEPVVLIHWGVAATWAEPLLDQPALASRYQLLSYHRAGYAGSGPLHGPPTMAAHAAQCHQLMRELGITSAHIVGHSSSVPIALQRYRTGDKAAAVDIFFRGALGPGYRAALDHGLPGAFEQAIADADTFFTQEMPAAVADGLTSFFARHPIPEPP